MSAAAAGVELPSDAAEIIDRFQLKGHVEGGYFARTFESDHILPGNVLPSGFSCDRPSSTSILFMLVEGQISHLHKIKSDEGWHHYAGDPLLVIECCPEGSAAPVCCTALGHPLSTVSGLGTEKCTANFAKPTDSTGIITRCTPQYFVRSNRWFGAKLPAGSRWALVGCTVAPGFYFAEFQLADSQGIHDAVMCGVQERLAEGAPPCHPEQHPPGPSGVAASSAWVGSQDAAVAIVQSILPPIPAETACEDAAVSRGEPCAP